MTDHRVLEPGSPNLRSPKTLRTDHRGLVALGGDYDSAVTADLAAALARAAAGPELDIIVDASAITFMDAAALSVLVQANMDLAPSGRSLRLTNPARCVRRLLEVCDMAQLIDE